MKMEIDYFEQYHLLPQEVQDLLLEFGMTNEFTYETCRKLIKKLNKLGWTCDYDLSATPFDLKPLMKIIAKDVKLNVGEHKVLCDIAINKDGNLQTLWKEDMNKLFPDGYCTQGYNDQIILKPFRTIQL